MDFRLRRVRWLAVGAGLAVAAIAVGVFNSRRCLIVIYNQADFVRTDVRVTGSGESWRVGALDPQNSLQRSISVDAPEGVWHIQVGPPGELETEAWFEPGPGRRLVVHIWPGGEVEIFPQDAWWE